MAQRICMVLFIVAIASGCATKTPSPQSQVGPQWLKRPIEMLPPDTTPKAPREIVPGELPVEPLVTAAHFNPKSKIQNKFGPAPSSQAPGLYTLHRSLS